MSDIELKIAALNASGLSIDKAKKKVSSVAEPGFHLRVGPPWNHSVEKTSL